VCVCVCVCCKQLRKKLPSQAHEISIVPPMDAENFSHESLEEDAHTGRICTVSQKTRH